VVRIEESEETSNPSLPAPEGALAAGSADCPLRLLDASTIARRGKTGARSAVRARSALHRSVSVHPVWA
jgi:hypothetical protein